MLQTILFNQYSITSAVLDGIYLLHIIQGPFQSIQQNITYILGASVLTNAIIKSPAFCLASSGQLLNKYPFGNRPVVAYDEVNVILSPQTINYGSQPLDAKKLYRSNYELKSCFVTAFGTSEFVLQQIQVVVAHQSAQDNVL
ncbi:MAG: hypothetical protein EZS28_030043 [Streblomastix strix]|uniref:Uncharacterized protein n=1 Tax=Streblomastix strix TaxID=222440 RepID=A0A5J4UWZ4_9EUKA|nr:MAG: hypothetical protein EZS28_030043 [Streblomastix strix]